MRWGNHLKEDSPRAVHVSQLSVKRKTVVRGRRLPIRFVDQTRHCGYNTALAIPRVKQGFS